MERVLKPIRTEADYTEALHVIEALFDAEADTAEGAYLDALATLVSAYEQKHWPIEPVAAVDMLRFYMEQNGRSQADLATLLGSRSRASEILSGKRELTLDQIRRISSAWRIPVALLIGELVAA